MPDSLAPQANAIRRAVQVAPRRLWQHYMAALAVILTLLVASFLLAEFAISNGLSVAETLNIAGRQRMISQRILLLTSSPPETATDQRDLAALLDEMAAAHQLLSGDPDLADNVRSVYFQPDAATDLDRMMTAFIAAGRALLANDDPPGQRRILHALGRDSLLFRLGAAVKVHEVQTRDHANMSQMVEIGSLIAAFLTLMAVTQVIFRPAHRLTKVALNLMEMQQAQIQNDAKRLKAALGISEKLRQEQSDFTYALSHELKSPGNTLAMLLTELQAIREIRDNAEAAQLVQVGQATVRRMAQLIESVLAYRRTIDGDTSNALVDLDAVIVAVQVDLAAAIRESNADLRIQPLGQLVGNAVQLRELLLNLLSNAIKFRAKDRALKISVRAERAELQGMTTIFVSDNGIGIDPDYRSRVFGLFKRLHIYDAYPGSGMGLTLCAHVAAKHGGTITIHDGPAPGVGSNFVVVLHDTDCSLPAAAAVLLLPAAAPPNATAAPPIDTAAAAIDAAA